MIALRATTSQAHEPAELLLADADATVDDPLPGRCASSRASRRTTSAGDAGARRDALGREGLGRRAQLVEPVAKLREAPRARQPLLEERAHHRHEQERVGARADEVVLVGDARRLGAARVDDDELARRARASPPGAARCPGAVMMLPFETSGVGADAEEEVRAVDVRARAGAPDARTSRAPRACAGAGRRSWPRSAMRVRSDAEQHARRRAARARCGPWGCPGRRRLRRGRARAMTPAMRPPASRDGAVPVGGRPASSLAQRTARGRGRGRASRPRARPPWGRRARARAGRRGRPRSARRLAALDA